MLLSLTVAELTTNFAIFAAIQTRFFQFLAAKNLQPNDGGYSPGKQRL